MSGASGLVGSRFVEMYGEDYEIANIDLTNNVNILDIASIEAFVDMHPSDTLIHLAAFTNTVEADKQKGDKAGLCYQVNVVGTENIANVCQKRKMHLVHISTDFVFDGTKKDMYVEDDLRSPIDWYGQTKAMAEEVVEQSNTDYTIIRIAYPYRANFDLKPDIITKIRTRLKDNTLPPQFTDTTITPTFVDDIARGFQVIVTQRKRGIYHMVGSTVVSPYDLAVAVARLYHYDELQVKKGLLETYLNDNPRPFARYGGVSNVKATQDLGLTFATLDQGLRMVVQQQKAAE